MDLQIEGQKMSISSREVLTGAGQVSHVDNVKVSGGMDNGGPKGVKLRTFAMLVLL